MIIILLSFVAIGICLALIYYKKHIEPFKMIDNNMPINNYQQVMEEPKIDWSIMQHIGWLYKDGSNQNFDNMNFYFNQLDATFCALPQQHSDYSRDIIQLGGEIPKKGSYIQINGESYMVVFPEEEE